jgi:hypothetical protein
MAARRHGAGGGEVNALQILSVVGSLSARGGDFVSWPLRPSRTTWYAVRYPGLDGGFVVFTPVVKVSVH